MLLFLWDMEINTSYIVFFILHVLLFSIPILHGLDVNVSDCLGEGSTIIDGTSPTLISPGRTFELGFFSPDGNSNKSRYLGIWYCNQSNPKIVVWVANRDKPLLETSGSLVVEDGNAKVLDKKGVIHWSTNVPSERGHPNIFNCSNQNSSNEVHYVDASSSSHGNFTSCVAFNSTRRLCLSDDGNVILKYRKQRDKILWQSFEHPTDTFLPTNESLNLISDGGLNLTSWQNSNNPVQGNFTLSLHPGSSNELVIEETGGRLYWKSGMSPFDKIPSAVSELLSPNPKHNNMRLVMNFNGQIQFWKWESERGWYLNWSEPKDGCSLYQKCGNFGSCNSNSGRLCKCLPGFKPGAKWNSGDFSVGCSQKSGNPCQRNNNFNDTFFRLPRMKVGNRSCSLGVSNTAKKCETECRNTCSCVAYAYEIADCTGTSTSSEKKCLTWSDVLTDLQEESPYGFSISVRTTPSDIKSTPRDCNPCGTYIIPYPLSTGGNCGDPSYFLFHCNNKTGQVNFSTSSGIFKVTSIDPDERSFTIQVVHTNSCDRNLSILSHTDSLSFNITNCTVVKDQPLIEVEQPFIEVELHWLPPKEPACSASSDCRNWPHSTCKRKEGKMRCVCRSNFSWDGSKLGCKREFPLKIVVPCIAGASAIIILCGIFFIYHIRKRRITKGGGSFEIEGDDTEAIDVPFFEWGVILAATNNFADENKLGTGGFGSVYRGKLPDEKEIAVKRLSSVSVQGIQEFRTEVVLIAKLQHRNLVRLLGYCVKADEKILIYEYMTNGSLDSCLFDDQTHSAFLDWEKRFDVILGIARGLVYLHQDSRLRIIHRDLKPSNILLDEELNPKISDFGIARIVAGKETQASTKRVVGTYGYMSPEYAYEGLFSVKSDVFSFGVVMLETISGRRNSRIFMLEHGISLLAHAWKLWTEDKVLELMDQTLRESCNPSEFLKCARVGLLCVQEDPSDRPTMSTVVMMLSSENASLPLPKQPAFITRKPLSESQEGSSSSVFGSSLNDIMTLSLGGR